MREIDRIAVEETGPNLFQMMENAGRNLASLAMRFLGRSWQSARIAVLAGSGGGICAGRHLANRKANVSLCLTKPEGLGEVPAFQRKTFQITCGTEVDFVTLQPKPVDLILDALIGYGLQSAPWNYVSERIQWANQSGAEILSLDVPSGVKATTGEAPGECINANWTMTLALPKTGLRSEMTGELFLADIGIPDATFRRIGVNYLSPFADDFVIALKQLT